jgi:hypothetical protein
VEHDAGVREGVTLALSAGGEQKAAKTQGAAEGDGAGVRFHVGDGVLEGHGGHDIATRTVGVEAYGVG